MTCKTHPDAPHGFVRSASHSEDRYVCECEFWEEPKMNERIKELAKQATSYTWNGNDVTEELDEQKFAELIVRECVAMCDVKSEDPLLYKQGVIFAVNRCQQNIKQHFGVEE
jgi:hypothetical protein